MAEKKKPQEEPEVFSWFRLELNQRHADFQSTALPTELQNHFGKPKLDKGVIFVKGKEDITPKCGFSAFFSYRFTNGCRIDVYSRFW